MKNCFSSFLKSVLWGIFLLVWAIHPVSGAVLIDRIVAVVNREIITQSDLDLAAKSAGMTPLERDQEALDADIPFYQKEILSLMIEEKLILQEARRKGVRVSGSELDFALSDIELQNKLPDRASLKSAVAQGNIPWDQYVADLENRLTAMKLINREVESNLVLNDKEVRAYYKDHAEQFKIPDRIRLRQIFFQFSKASTAEQIEKVRLKAEGVLAEANKDVPFIRLVQRHSDGPEKQKDGDLGFFQQGDLALVIDRVVFKLREGEISPLVQTAMGFHIFKVQEWQKGRLRPFDKARPKIEEIVISEKRENLRRKWLDALWERSFVEIK
jgi:parvulin-like peptidyl-prolyl isomerase